MALNRCTPPLDALTAPSLSTPGHSIWATRKYQRTSLSEIQGTRKVEKQGCIGAPRGREMMLFTSGALCR